MTERPKSTFARRVRAAKPRDKRHEVRDDVVSGLMLRIFPSGARTFTLESMVRGRGRYATIGNAHEMTVPEARREARRLIASYIEPAKKDNGPRTPGHPAAGARGERRCPRARGAVPVHAPLAGGPVRRRSGFGRGFRWRHGGGRRPGPSHGPGDGDRELLIALDGDKAGKTAREIAVDIWGRKRVAEDWYPDCPLRSTVRRRVKRLVDDTIPQTKRFAHRVRAAPLLHAFPRMCGMTAHIAP